MAVTYRLTYDASGNPSRTKDDFAAAAAPDANDDFSTAGWKVGSFWYVPTTDTLYICEDQSTAAAVWTVVGAVSSDLSSLEVDLSVSGAHTVDRDTAATHDLTLTGDSTLTPDHSDPPTGEAIDLRILIRQDGTGSRTLAWGGTITWVGGSAPTMPTAANALLTVGLVSVDDAATWLGYYDQTGTSLTAATTVESETTFGIAAAVGTDTEYARQDHTHGTPANPVTVAAVQALGHYELLMVGSSPPEPLEDGTGNDWLWVWVTP